MGTFVGVPPRSSSKVPRDCSKIGASFCVNSFGLVCPPGSRTPSPLGVSRKTTAPGSIVPPSRNLTLALLWLSRTYYEDGFQELADRGGRIGTAPIGAVGWVEVDDERDLAKAREVVAGWTQAPR